MAVVRGAEHAENGCNLLLPRRLVKGRGSIPDAHDGADGPVGRDDGAAVQGIKGDGIYLSTLLLFLLRRLGVYTDLDRILLAAGRGDGRAVGEGGADEVLGGYIDVELVITKGVRGAGEGDMVRGAQGCRDGRDGLQQGREQRGPESGPLGLGKDGFQKGPKGRARGEGRHGEAWMAFDDGDAPDAT